jgi:hypothetical protein
MIISNAAGGEGGHGAAKPDPVIHRYRVNKAGLNPQQRSERGRLIASVWGLNAAWTRFAAGTMPPLLPSVHRFVGQNSH